MHLRPQAQRAKANVNGASIELGHPEQRDLKRGLVTMCAAGGMAPAVIIERV